MNIRFAPDSVRLRVSSDEALRLAREGKLTAAIALPEQELLLEISLVRTQDQPATFRYQGFAARANLREKEFLALLESEPSRQSGMRVPLGAPGTGPPEFVFEIDLFSRKNGNRG